MIKAENINNTAMWNNTTLKSRVGIRKMVKLEMKQLEKNWKRNLYKMGVEVEYVLKWYGHMKMEMNRIARTMKWL